MPIPNAVHAWVPTEHLRKAQYVHRHQSGPDGCGQEMCADGKFDSVIGDRIKIHDTFREFVIYDAAQAYPSFEMQYLHGCL